MMPSTTSTIRRTAKSLDPPPKFYNGRKPRHRTASVASLAAFAVLITFLAPIKIFTPRPRTTEIITTRVNIPLTSYVSDDVITRGEPGKCLKHVLYDKPVKTGSTAIMFAIREYLKKSAGLEDKPCGTRGPLSCHERAKSICNGTYEEKDFFSIIGHFQPGSRDLVNCLRPHYYIVTSIRDPYQRRKSAYLWNRTLNASHFGVPHTASFAEFMERLPRCQLYHYYDGRGMPCDVGVPLEERINDIVDRVDEVMDIYDEPVGPLHRLIHEFMARENESIKVEENDFAEEFDRETLKEETMLYDRLREKRVRKPDINRLPC